MSETHDDVPLLKSSRPHSHGTIRSKDTIYIYIIQLYKCICNIDIHLFIAIEAEKSVEWTDGITAVWRRWEDRKDWNGCESEKLTIPARTYARWQGIAVASIVRYNCHCRLMQAHWYTIRTYYLLSEDWSEHFRRLSITICVSHRVFVPILSFYFSTKNGTNDESREKKTTKLIAFNISIIACVQLSRNDFNQINLCVNSFIFPVLFINYHFFFLFDSIFIYFRFELGIFGAGIWARRAIECSLTSQTYANIIQTSPITYDEIILCHQSQPRCKRLETTVTEDWIAQASFTSEYN